MSANCGGVRRIYEPNGKDCQGWFCAFIDDSTGCLAILSDFGDYSHRWNLRGMPEGVSFSRFLTRCDAGYIRRKLSPRDVYDEDRTVANIREEVCRLRRSGFFTQQEARDEWDGAAEALGSEEAFGAWLNGTGISGAFELVARMPCPSAVAFMKRVWPRIVERLASEVTP